MKEIKFTCWLSKSWNNSPCEKCGLPEGDDENCGMISPVEPVLREDVWRDCWALDIEDSLKSERIHDEDSVLRPMFDALEPKEKCEVEIIVRYKEKE